MTASSPLPARSRARASRHFCRRVVTDGPSIVVGTARWLSVTLRLASTDGVWTVAATARWLALTVWVGMEGRVGLWTVTVWARWLSATARGGFFTAMVADHHAEEEAPSVHENDPVAPGELWVASPT